MKRNLALKTGFSCWPMLHLTRPPQPTSHYDERALVMPQDLTSSLSVFDWISSTCQMLPPEAKIVTVTRHMLFLRAPQRPRNVDFSRSVTDASGVFRHSGLISAGPMWSTCANVLVPTQTISACCAFFVETLPNRLHLCVQPT